MSGKVKPENVRHPGVRAGLVEIASTLVGVLWMLFTRLIHDVDLALDVYSGAVTVKAAQSLSVKSGYDDVAMATLHVEAGGTRDSKGVIRLVASRVSCERPRKMRWVKGDVVLEIDFLARAARHGVSRDGFDVTERKSIPTQDQDQLAAHLSSFADAIATGRPSVGGLQATRA